MTKHERLEGQATVSEHESFDTVMDRLRAGDDDAARAVFLRFTHRLIALAHTKLESMSQTRDEVEDVVQSVYKSFFIRSREGQFLVDDWDELWGLLTVIALRKCSNRRTYHRAQRRGLGWRGLRLGSASPTDLAGQLIDRKPTPAEAAALSDTVRELFSALDEHDRPTVGFLLQGFTAREIAISLRCSERTVRRIRSRLKERMRGLYDSEARR